MTVGYGHGIAVTPLHLATGYATLFNGGIWRPATLVKIDSRHPVPQGRRVFTEETSYRMRALLRLVVTDGTGKQGRRARLPGRRQDRHRREDRRRPLYRRSGGHHLRGRFPDGQPPLCGRRHARRSQVDRRNLRLPHRRLERRPGRVAGDRPDRRPARSPAGRDPRRQHGRGAPLRSARKTDRCALPISRESAAIPG